MESSHSVFACFRKEDTVSYVNFSTEDTAPKKINIIFQVIPSNPLSVLISGCNFAAALFATLTESLISFSSLAGSIFLSLAVPGVQV